MGDYAEWEWAFGHMSSQGFFFSFFFCLNPLFVGDFGVPFSMCAKLLRLPLCCVFETGKRESNTSSISV